MERPKNAPKAASGRPIHLSLALASVAKPNDVTKKGIKGMLKVVQAEQTENGSWSPWPETRPPIFGPSVDTLTSLATLALHSDAAGDDATKAARDKGIKWLKDTKSDDDPQSNALRLILWIRLELPADEWRPFVQRIKDRQNKDGGWGQTKEMPSDAWATGQALYALAHAKIKSDDPAISRGQAFLINAQRENGSWPMNSRPTKPGEEGSKNVIPITGAGSSWAVLGLVRSR
jgi:hypothetical protein